MWRTIEHSSIPMVGLISGHPREVQVQSDTRPILIRSRHFASQFSTYEIDELLLEVQGYITYHKRGPLGSCLPTSLQDAEKFQ